LACVSFYSVRFALSRYEKEASIMLAYLRRFVIVAISAGAVMMSLCSFPLVAQEPKTTPSETPKTTASETPAKPGAARRAYDPARRVPPYFGQIGISEEQREAIYKIQTKRSPRIEALVKQLADLRAESLTECEGVLTAPQKLVLEQKREVGGRAAATRTRPERP
jgi:hypothetical protein